MKSLSALLLSLFVFPLVQTTPEYSIEAIRYGTIPEFRLAGLERGSDRAHQVRPAGKLPSSDEEGWREAPGWC